MSRRSYVTHHHRTSRWRPWRAAVIGAVAALLVSLFPVPASAHLFNKTRTDDSFVDFASDEDNTDHHLFWNHFVHFEQIDQYGARTDLTVSELPRWGWNGVTDVVWFAAALAPNVTGDEMCRVVNFNGRCDRARVRFAENLTRSIPGAAGFFLACHEFAHAYGFEHNPEGCMWASEDIYNPPWDGTLTGHMIDHINAVY
jgi:hypothetical protein